jgi:hypothetical protein
MRTLTLLLVLAAASRAQSLEDKLDKKLAAPFIKKAAWVLDFDAAKKQAKESQKVLFAYFTRSFLP